MLLSDPAAFYKISFAFLHTPAVRVVEMSLPPEDLLIGVAARVGNDASGQQGGGESLREMNHLDCVRSVDWSSGLIECTMFPAKSTSPVVILIMSKAQFQGMGQECRQQYGLWHHRPAYLPLFHLFSPSFRVSIQLQVFSNCKS